MLENQLSLDGLFSIIKEKSHSAEENSYTRQLIKSGIEKITRKIGEEALETMIAAFIYKQKNDQKTRQDLIGEVADLFYHSLVLLAAQEIEFSEILEELKKRNNQ